MKPSSVPDIQAWLLSARHDDDGGVSLMARLVEVVRQHGLPLWRASFSLMTRHPELVWRSVQWIQAEGVKMIERSRASLDEPFFQRSPIAMLRRGAPPIRVRLEGESRVAFRKHPFVLLMRPARERSRGSNHGR